MEAPGPIENQTPGPIPTPDASRDPVRRSPIWLWILTICLIGAVVIMQRPDPGDPNKRQSAAKGLGTIEPPGPDGLVLMAKVILGMKQASPGSGQVFQSFVDSLAGWDPASPLAGPVSATNLPRARPEPFPAAERLRSVIVAGESLGPNELGWRLREVEKQLDPTSPLVQDVQAVRLLYGVGPPVSSDQAQDKGDDSDAAHASRITPVKPDELDPELRAGLETRHGFFASLALSHANTAGPVREKAAAQGLLLVLIMTAGVLLVGAALLTGLVLLIVGLASLHKLKAGLVRPNPATEWPFDASHEVADQLHIYTPGPKSVWLETVCVFVAGFLALKLGIEGLHLLKVGEHALVWSSLLGQWALLLTIFWPVLRGMPWTRWRSDIGWHAGRGVFREILAGLAAYLAALPLYFLMAIVVVIITFIIGAVTRNEPPLPEGNKIIDIVGSGSPAVLIMLFLLASVWAPVVEESIFRGALFRHLRRRVALPLAALVSALAFAVMHGYVIQGLFMVGTLGFVFGLIREWRGSLIGCVTAHFIHNTVILTLLISVMSLAAP